MMTPGQLERARLRRKAVQDTLSSFITDALCEVMGEPERDWTIARVEQVERKRRDLEASAEVLEGFRARLMMASAALQRLRDRRGNGQAKEQAQAEDKQDEAREGDGKQGEAKEDTYHGVPYQDQSQEARDYRRKAIEADEVEDGEGQEAEAINAETARVHKIGGPEVSGEGQGRADETPTARPKKPRK
jgi:hypothetical protein